MADPWASPGDPTFFLHHTWMDKIWWEWQAKDLPARLTDIAGPTTQTILPPPPPNFPNQTTPSSHGWKRGVLEERAGDPGNVTTLGHILDVLGLVPNTTIADVMDIGGGTLCYEYV